MNTSRLNRNKMTNSPNLGSPLISNSLISRVAANASSGSASKKLRSELRRVMSDRVLKITKCSQQQTVEKAKQKTESESSNSNLNLNQTKNENSNLTTSSNNNLNSNPNNTNLNIQNEDNNNSNPIYKTPSSFTDKSNLIEYIKNIYHELINNKIHIFSGVKEIINAINVYSSTNNLDLEKIVDEILKENLILTNFQLKQKYKNSVESDCLKIESQIQVLLQIENYVIQNKCITTNKVKVDDDFVWEMANSIRWLSQTFKDFKIEKFLFGEIYSNFSPLAPDLILSLMEELGYDKEDNLEENNTSINSITSPSTSIHITPNKSPSISKNANNYSQFDDIAIKETQKINTQLHNILKEDSNSNSSFTHFSKVNSLFEDYNTNDAETHENDDCQISSQTNDDKDRDSDDLLNDFKRKKPMNRFTNFSVTTTAVRSIVIQTKKRMRLKIRSPCKSPSKNLTNNNQSIQIASNNNSRKSPRVSNKDKQTLTESDEQNGKKRPRTYLITDTPDHKQNTTIIRTKQEKIRKRFSFQPLTSNNTQSSSTNTLPVIPDTPVKNDRFLNSNSEHAQTNCSTAIPVINSRFSEIFKTNSSIYSSPKKIFSPKKNSIFD